MVCSRMLTQYTKAPSWQPVPYFQKCYLKSSLSRASCLPPDTWLAVEQIRFLVPMKGYTLSLVWVSCQPFFYYFYFLFTWSCYIALASLEVTVQTGTQRGDPLASTSRVLGLKGCTVTLGLASTFYALSLCVRACARTHTHSLSSSGSSLPPLSPAPSFSCGWLEFTGYITLPECLSTGVAGPEAAVSILTFMSEWLVGPFPVWQLHWATLPSMLASFLSWLLIFMMCQGDREQYSFTLCCLEMNPSHAESNCQETLKERNDPMLICSL